MFLAQVQFNLMTMDVNANDGRAELSSVRVESTWKHPTFTAVVSWPMARPTAAAHHFLLMPDTRMNQFKCR